MIPALPLWARLAGIGVAAAVLLAAGFGAGHRWQAGAVARAEAETANVRREVATAYAGDLAKELARRDAVQAENETIRRNYAALAADAAAAGRDFTRRLQDVSRSLAAARRAAEAAGVAGAADAARIASREAAIVEAAGELDAACRRDADRLAALIRQVEPQVADVF